jgi:hypothetical protein
MTKDNSGKRGGRKEGRTEGRTEGGRGNVVDRDDKR